MTKNNTAEEIGNNHDSITPAKIAVFDVDRTFIVGTTAEVQLIHFLRRRGMLPLYNLFRNLFGFIRQLPNGLEQIAVRKSVYLHGLNVKAVMNILPEYFETRLRPRISEKVKEYMGLLREKGYEIIFISGTLDFIIEQLVEKMSAHGGMGSVLEIRNGQFTGRILGIHPYYHGKVKALHAYLGERPVDYENSYGFGDSWADIPLLSMFGNPFAVNPGRILKYRARKIGWPILQDERPRIED